MLESQVHVNCYNGKFKCPDYLPTETDRNSVPHLQPVIEFIHKNLDKDLSLVSLAAVVTMSHYHFARSFKGVMGITPHQYIIQHRMEWAKQLLANTQLSITEITHRVGLSNQSHFTAQFRKVVGISPKRYRDGIWKD